MRTWLGVVVGVALLAGCEPPPPTEQDPCVEDPASCVQNPENTSLWPLTAGSSWTYRITDPIRGVFEKTVTIAGPATIPGTGRSAILMKSVQPHLEEHSYQLEDGGLAKRAREEDFKAGALARVAVWNPDTIKALTTPQPLGWEYRATIRETVTEGGVTEEKEKLFLWRVVEVDVPLTVGGVEHKAIKVLRDREDATGKQRTYWYVPGIGKVREEGERTEELIRFEIK